MNGNSQALIIPLHAIAFPIPSSSNFLASLGQGYEMCQLLKVIGDPSLVACLTAGISALTDENAEMNSYKDAWPGPHFFPDDLVGESGGK